MDFVFDRGDETISDWVCTIVLKQYPADTALVSRVIAPDNNKWPGFLTPLETAELTVGVTYFLTGDLVNATTGEQDQAQGDVRLSLEPDWVA